MVHKQEEKDMQNKKLAAATSIAAGVGAFLLSREIRSIKEDLARLDAKVGSMSLGYWKMLGRVRDLELENEAKEMERTRDNE